jgi:hypothetical protein
MKPSGPSPYRLGPLAFSRLIEVRGTLERRPSGEPMACYSGPLVRVKGAGRATSAA